MFLCENFYWLLVGVVLVLPLFLLSGASSSGRTAGSGPASRGSNPRAPALILCGEYFICVTDYVRGYLGVLRAGFEAVKGRTPSDSGSVSPGSNPGSPAF